MKILKEIRKKRGLRQVDVAKMLGVTQTAYCNYENGFRSPDKETIKKLAEIFGVSTDYLLETDESHNENLYPPPRIAQNVTRFPVIGTVAAGYGAEAFEDWASGEAFDVPTDWLRGRPREDFFALRVHGDSMYPSYKDGDLVLVLRQTTLNHPGDVGVVRYNGEEATLKRIDYVYGEDWMRLRPENATYPAITIRDAELENCQVLGIPWLVVREIRE